VSAGGEVVSAARVLLLDADGADRDVELEQVDLGQIGDQRLLWIDLGGGEEAERLARVLEPLGLPSRTLRYVVEPLGRPRLDAYGEAMHVEVTGLRPVGEGRHEAVFLNCVVGRNWLLTSHDGPVKFLEEFRQRVRGGSELGSLDAPWLLATLLDWQVNSYQDEIANLVTMIDDLDEVVLRGTEPTEVTLDRLVRVRRRVSWLRGLLVPHQQVFLQLSRPELDLLSTSDSAAAFSALNARVAAAVDAVDSAREMLIASFDVLMTRTAQRTNDVMKVLTIASVALLPSTLIAGILGMNVSPALSIGHVLFWVIIALMAALMATAILIARRQHWF
jgi:magnesium transporter